MRLKKLIEQGIRDNGEMKETRLKNKKIVSVDICVGKDVAVFDGQVAFTPDSHCIKQCLVINDVLIAQCRSHQTFQEIFEKETALTYQRFHYETAECESTSPLTASS
jgi:hypothetical protein